MNEGPRRSLAPRRLAVAVLVIPVVIVAALWVRRSADTDPPDRDELIADMAADTTNSFDLDESTCVVALITPVGERPPFQEVNELLAVLPAALSEADRSALEQLEECLDPESNAEIADQLRAVDDVGLRRLAIRFLVGDPTAPLDETTAACVADVLVGAGVVDDLVTAADGPITPELATALLDAETECA